MKIYNKIFIACNSYRDAKRVDGDEAYLSFVVPVEKNRKRIETAIQWAKRYYRQDSDKDEPITYEIDNTPTTGYKIIGFSSRYSTSNKHIYVMHPTLNFYFELTVENFIELTKETTIKGGVIEDGLIFYFQNGKNGLVRYDGESAKRMVYADRIIQAIDTSEVPLYSEVILDKRNSVGTKLFYLGYGAVKVSGKMYYNDEIIKRIKEGSLERNVWSQLNYQYEHVQTVINAVDGVDTYYNRPVKTPRSVIKDFEFTDVVVEEKRHIFMEIADNGSHRKFIYVKQKKPKIASVLENTTFKGDDEHVNEIMFGDTTTKEYKQYPLRVYHLQESWNTESKIRRQLLGITDGTECYVSDYTMCHMEINKITIVRE